LIVQADILGQMTDSMKYGITHKGAVEINSLQVYFKFLVQFVKTFMFDLSSKFLSRPQNYISRPQMGRNP